MLHTDEYVMYSLNVIFFSVFSKHFINLKSVLTQLSFIIVIGAKSKAIEAIGAYWSKNGKKNALKAQGN